MPVVNLDTTNVLLGIMAAVSVLEALLLIVVSVMAYRGYQGLLRTIHQLEEEQIRPLTRRVDGFIDKVEGFLSEVKAATSAVTRTTEQAASFVSRPVTRAVGVARAVSVALSALFNHRHAPGTWQPGASESARQKERSEHYAG